MVDTPAPTWFPEILSLLLARRDLSEQQMQQVMDEVLAGRCGDVETAAVLIALKCKGESSAEIAGAARALYQHMVPLPTGRDDVLDTSGTGGDGLNTFNISTAAALVAAGAGVPVVKAGNRAVSGRSGSADLLAELGVAIQGSVEWTLRCLNEAGLAFCFAPHFHPVVGQVAPLRRRLGIPTLFNCVGPLGNPARAGYRLFGIGRAEWLDPLAGALVLLGTRRAVLVHGKDGLDEVSLSAPTQVRIVQGGQITKLEWSAEDFGLEPCSLEELRCDGPAASAAVVRAVLSGESGPARRVVLANAAAALLAAEKVADLKEGVRLAAESIDSGWAETVLQRLIVIS